MADFGFLNYEPATLKSVPCRNAMLRLAMMMKKRCGEPAIMDMATAMLVNPKMAQTMMEHVLKATGFYFVAEEGKVKSVAYILGGQVVVNIATLEGFEGRGYGKQLLHQLAKRWEEDSKAKLYSPVDTDVQEFFQKAGWEFACDVVNGDGTRDMLPPSLKGRYDSEAGDCGLKMVAGHALMDMDFHLWELAYMTREKLAEKNISVE